MSTKRGNPTWGQFPEAIPAADTQFELEVRRLGLTRDAYVGSSELRSWCERNKNRCYIPEWLLAEWSMDIDPNFTGRA